MIGTMNRTLALVLFAVAAGSMTSAAQAFETRTVDLSDPSGTAHYTDPDKQQPFSTTTTRNLNGTDTTTTNRSLGQFNFSSSFIRPDGSGNGPDPAGFPSSGFTTGRDMMKQR
jgi:hypothetical protein